jgi:hypothetical protein
MVHMLVEVMAVLVAEVAVTVHTHPQVREPLVETTAVLVLIAQDKVVAVAVLVGLVQAVLEALAVLAVLALRLPLQELL